MKFSFLSSITAAAYALSATCNILLMTSSVSDVYSERRDLMNQMIELLVIYNKSTDVSSQVIKVTAGIVRFMCACVCLDTSL